MTQLSEIIFRDSHFFLVLIVSLTFIIYFLLKKKKQLQQDKQASPTTEESGVAKPGATPALPFVPPRFPGSELSEDTTLIKPSEYLKSITTSPPTTQNGAATPTGAAPTKNRGLPVIHEGAPPPPPPTTPW